MVGRTAGQSVVRGEVRRELGGYAQYIVLHRQSFDIRTLNSSRQGVEFYVIAILVPYPSIRWPRFTTVGLQLGSQSGQEDGTSANKRMGCRQANQRDGGRKPTGGTHGG